LVQSEASAFFVGLFESDGIRAEIIEPSSVNFVSTKSGQVHINLCFD